MNSFTGSSKDVVFGSFYSKGYVPEGTCDDWTTYRSQSVRLPFDNIFYSSLSITYGGYQFETGYKYNWTATCSDSTTVTKIVNSLLTGTSFSQICGNSRFIVENCPGVGITMCAGCKRICKPTWCADVFYTPGAYTTPCVSCTARKAFYQVMDFQVRKEILYPQLLSPLSLTPGTTTVDVKLNVSTAGNLYCQAVQYPGSVSTALSVKSIGAFLRSKGAGIYTIRVSNLIPTTQYNIYCYTEDFAGNGMDLPAVLATVKATTTLCCNHVSYTIIPDYIPSFDQSSSLSSSLLPIFTFKLAAMSSTNLTARFSLSQSLPCNVTKDFTSSVIQPNSFLLPARQNNPKSFVIMSYAGCFTLTARLFSSATNTIISVKNMSLTISPIAQNTKPPQLSSAYFTDNGLGIIVKFNMPTDEAVSKVSRVMFSCATILSFPGDSFATCTWSSQSQLSISLGRPSRTNLKDELSVLGSSIRSALCLETQVKTSCQYITAGTSISIGAPYNPDIPVVSVSAPSKISPCGSLPLDPTNSVGNAGHDWQSIVWSVKASYSNSSSVKYFLSLQLTNFANANFNTTTKSYLFPNSFLQPGKFVITLSLTNCFNQTGSTTVFVEMVSSGSVPLVRVLGPKSITVYRSSIISLFASASLTPCGTVMSANQTALTYTWTIFSGLKLLTDIVSTSNDQRYYLLAPYTLSALKTYTIQIVTTSALGDVSSSSVSVQVLLNQVYAIISGGSFITVSVSSSFLLDGSQSYSADNPTNTSLLSHSWTCIETTALYFGDACQGIRLSPVAKNLLDFSSYKSSGVVRSLSIALYVKSADGVTANTTVTLQLRPIVTAPVVALAPPLTKYNADTKIILTAKIIANDNCLGVWSILDTSLAASNSTFTVSRIVTTSEAGIFYFQQGIPASTLSPGGSYTIRFTANYINSNIQSVYAQITLVINRGPVGGVMEIDPASGTALTTSFTISTFNWNDEPVNLPLFFTYKQLLVPSPQLAASATSPQLLIANTPSTIVSVVLASGQANFKYNVSVQVIATDQVGSSTMISTTAIVYPQASTSAKLLQSTQKLLQSSASSDPAATIQVISAVTTSLNSVNCTKATSTICAKYNRFPCFATSQTCGACYDGYYGTLGDSNTYCALDLTALGSIGDRCSKNQDCLSNLCQRGLCQASQKKCPNDCSGAGTCRYTAYNGTRIGYCGLTNPYCYATCQCTSGFYGADCRLSAVDFSYYRQMRASMCSSFLTTSKLQNVDLNTAINHANTVSNLLLDPSQSDLSTLKTCTTVLLNTVANYPDIAGLPSVVDVMMKAFAAVLAYPDIPAETVTSVTNALAVLIEGVQLYQVTGEPQDQIVLNYVRLGSNLVSVNTSSLSTSSVNAKIPVSAVEEVTSLPQNSVSFNLTKVRVAANQGIGVAVYQYNSDLSRNATLKTPAMAVKLTSAPLITRSVTTSQVKAIVSAGEAGQTSRRRLSDEDEVPVAITLQNLQDIRYYSTTPMVGEVWCLRTGVNYTQDVFCPDSGRNFTFHCPGTFGRIYNFTCPKFTLIPNCVSWNGVQYSYRSGCEVAAYSSSSTTCLCNISYASTSSSATSNLMVSTTADIIMIPIDVTITYESPVTFTSTSKDYVVMVSTSAIAAIVLIAFLSFRRIDKKTDWKPTGLRRYLFAEAAQYNESRGQSLLFKNNYFPIHESAVTSEASSSQPQQKRGVPMTLSFLSPQKQNNASANQRRFSLDWLFNSLLPTELSAMPMLSVFHAKYYEEHDIYALFRHPHYDNDFLATQDLLFHPENVSKSFRWILVGSRVLSVLFWDTYLIRTYFADDGTCEHQTVEEDCLSHKTMFNLQHLCTWTPTLDTYCQFHAQTTVNNMMNIAIVTAMSVILTVPLEHFFRFIMTKFILQRFESRVKHSKVPPLGAKIIPVTLNTNPGNSAATSTAMTVKDNNKKVAPEVAKKGEVVKKGVSNVKKLPVKPVPGGGKPGKPGPGGAKGAAASKGVAGKGKGAAASASSALTAQQKAKQKEKEKKAKEEEEAAAVFQYRHIVATYDLRDSIDIRGKYLRAVRFTLIQNMSDKISSNKETFFVLHHLQQEQIDKYLAAAGVTSWLRRPYFYFVKMRGQEEEASLHGDIKLHSMSELQVQSVLRQKRNAARLLKHYALYLERDIDRDIFILQQFLIESIATSSSRTSVSASTLDRDVANFFFLRKFALLDFYLPTYLIYSGMALFGVALALMTCFIFIFGMRIGERSSMSWALIFALGVTYEWLIVQPLTTALKWIVFVFVIKPKLLLHHTILKERAGHILHRRFGLIRTIHTGIQHFNAACRAARLFPDLPSTRLLVSMHDDDIITDYWYWNYFTMTSYLSYKACRLFTWMFFSWIFALIPSVFQEFFVDFLFTFMVCMAGIGIIALTSINPFISIGLGAVVFLAGLALPIYLVRSKGMGKMSRVIPTELDDTDHNGDLEAPVIAASKEVGLSSRLRGVGENKYVLSKPDEEVLQKLQTAQYDVIVDAYTKLTYPEYKAYKEKRYTKILRKLRDPTYKDSSEEEEEVEVVPEEKKGEEGSVDAVENDLQSKASEHPETDDSFVRVSGEPTNESLVRDFVTPTKPSEEVRATVKPVEVIVSPEGPAVDTPIKLEEVPDTTMPDVDDEPPSMLRPDNLPPAAIEAAKKKILAMKNSRLIPKHKIKAVEMLKKLQHQMQADNLLDEAFGDLLTHQTPNTQPQPQSQPQPVASDVETSASEVDQPDKKVPGKGKGKGGRLPKDLNQRKELKARILDLVKKRQQLQSSEDGFSSFDEAMVTSAEMGEIDEQFEEVEGGVPGRLKKKKSKGRVKSPSGRRVISKSKLKAVEMLRGLQTKMREENYLDRESDHGGDVMDDDVVAVYDASEDEERMRSEPATNIASRSKKRTPMTSSLSINANPSDYSSSDVGGYSSSGLGSVGKPAIAAVSSIPASDPAAAIAATLTRGKKRRGGGAAGVSKLKIDAKKFKISTSALKEMTEEDELMLTGGGGGGTAVVDEGVARKKGGSEPVSDLSSDYLLSGVDSDSDVRKRLARKSSSRRRLVSNDQPPPSSLHVKGEGSLKMFLPEEKAVYDVRNEEQEKKKE